MSREGQRFTTYKRFVRFLAPVLQRRNRRASCVVPSGRLICGIWDGQLRRSARDPPAQNVAGCPPACSTPTTAGWPIASGRDGTARGMDQRGEDAWDEHRTAFSNYRKARTLRGSNSGWAYQVSGFREILLQHCCRLYMSNSWHLLLCVTVAWAEMQRHCMAKLRWQVKLLFLTHGLILCCYMLPNDQCQTLIWQNCLLRLFPVNDRWAACWRTFWQHE